jgi:hypothetical protein
VPGDPPQLLSRDLATGATTLAYSLAESPLTLAWDVVDRTLFYLPGRGPANRLTAVALDTGIKKTYEFPWSAASSEMSALSIAPGRERTMVVFAAHQRTQISLTALPDKPAR